MPRGSAKGVRKVPGIKRQHSGIPESNDGEGTTEQNEKRDSQFKASLKGVKRLS